MGWYESDSVWTKRAAITLIAQGSGTRDFAISIPTGWDDFWDTIDADGEELRVVDAFGELLDYTVDNGSGGAFVAANRVGRIQIDGYSVQTDRAYCVWLYYGSSSTQGDASSGSPTSGDYGYIELAQPSGPYRMMHQPQMPGSSQVQTTFHKSSAEVADLWISYEGVLAKSWSPYNDGEGLEEPYYFTCSAVDTGGSAASSLVDVLKTRFVWVLGLGLWVRMVVQAGTSGSAYTTSGVLRVASPIYDANNLRTVVDTRVGWRVQDSRLTS